MNCILWAAGVLAALFEVSDAVCENKRPYKPWEMLTKAEQTAYVKAELCLMEVPNRLDVRGSQNLWDDLQWSHITQTPVVHDVGQFLPWHRFYISTHANLLRDECGYDGPVPYWDETADLELADIEDAAIFQEDTFGGNGRGSERCIFNGPFANTTLHIKREDQEPVDYCIIRTLSKFGLDGASMSSLSRCFQIDSYTEAWECLGNAPHTAGHGVLGLAIDVALTPGDPVFYLHHAWLDVMWWKWQTLDLPNRLTDMGGRNYPTAGFLAMLNMDPPGPEWTDYYGDPANTTTLDHVLTQVSIVPNITVGDIMDVGDETICADYIFSESMERFVRGF